MNMAATLRPFGHQGFVGRLPVAGRLLPPDDPRAPVLRARTWEDQNVVSSTRTDGTIGLQEVDLLGLPPGTTELSQGELVHAFGIGKLNGVFLHDPFAPGKKVTVDPFDQGVMYHILDLSVRLLMELGAPLQELFKNRVGHSFIEAYANAVSDMNAWFEPSTGKIKFGTSRGKWHLASDRNVPTHEFGHKVGDAHRPSFFGGEGGAIHEGIFGDVLDMFIHHDPELSEDFLPALGEPGDKTKGLRDGKNQLTLRDVGSEVHDRGQVYCGFWWSVRTKLTDPAGDFKLDPLQADRMLLRVYLAHFAHYASNRPKPADAVDALLGGIGSVHTQGQLLVDPAALRTAVLAEGARRLLVTPTQWQDRLAGDLPHATNLATVLGQFEGSGTRFVPVHAMQPTFGSGYVMQQQKLDTTAHGPVEVEGGYLHVVLGPDGEESSVSRRDVRTIVPGTVDDTVRVTQKDALANALRDARQKAHDAWQALQAKQRETASQRVLAPFDMAYRIWSTTSDELQQALDQNTTELPLVLPEGSDVLAYRFRGSLADYLVNVQDGTTTARQTVVVM